MPLAGVKTNQKRRYALLAGTMLAATAAVPPAGMAQSPLSGQSAERVIILAQGNAPAPIDPQTGQPKGAPPKGAQPPAKGPPPKGPQAGAPPPPPPPGGPPPGGQPKQVGQPPQQGLPPPGAQPKLVQPPPGTPPVGAPKVVQPPPGTPPTGAQPKVVQPPPGTPPAGAPKVVQPPPGTPPTGAQPKVVQPPQPAGVPPQGVAPGTPQQQQFGRPPQAPGQPAPVQQGVAPTTPPGGAAPGVAPGTPQQQFGGRPQGPGPQGGQPQQGMTVNVDQLRQHRQERREAGGRVVIEEPGRRVIVREGNTTIIRYDDNERFRRWGAPRLEQRGGEQYAYIARPGGYQVINVTDSHGRLILRVRRGPDGREIVLIDNRHSPGFGTGLGVGLAAGVILGLAAPVITIPRERYIVNAGAAPAPLLYETLEAPPLVAIERPYSLDEIRYNVALRDRMRRVDIDSITFESGSWEVTPEQQPRLAALAEAMQRVLARNPAAVIMLEGHTDAVGSDVDNLSLSDRRAESVAVILTDVYQIPPENLVTQGYGEQHLKVPTDGPVRENRRVTARNVTPLLRGGVASR